MPLYDYTCAQCGKISEVRHGFNERFDDPCPACGGLLRRVFNPAPIVFKGSGFYVTDSRKARGSDAPAETGEKPAAAKAESPKVESPKAEPSATPASSKTSEAKASESKASESKAADSAA
jgi:putative FmdB family regulatory protein